MVVPHGRNADAARALEAAFRRIAHEHMADLDVHNERLRVEALDARLWKGRWLTVLITPWCMNLVLLPAAQGEWTSGTGHDRIFYKFPAGDFAFLCGREPEIGEYHACALFSTMGDFVDQDKARETARASLDALFASPVAVANSPDQGVRGQVADGELEADSAQVAKVSLSRRAFLSGGATRR